jgi:hypothetical protein
VEISPARATGQELSPVDNKKGNLKWVLLSRAGECAKHSIPDARRILDQLPSEYPELVLRSTPFATLI